MLKEIIIQNVYSVPIEIAGDLDEISTEKFKGTVLHPQECLSIVSEIPAGLKIRPTTVLKNKVPIKINVDLVDINL